jgi:hypothetical protein
MNDSRRSFLTVIVPGAAVAGAALLASARQSSRPTHPAVPGTGSSQAQQSQQPPLEPPAFPKLTEAQKKAILTDDQKQIKKNVDELFSLAKDLKTQAEKIDATTELSVGFLEKTEEIEKLARKIRGLARG